MNNSLARLGFVDKSTLGTKRTIAAPQHFVRFSNRPVGVKRFQTVHDYGVDIARGLVVCTENLNPNVMVMKPAKNRV